MDFWWMYLFVPLCFWMSTRALYLNLSYLTFFFLFFFLRPVVCCYEWVLLHLQTKVCGTTKIKSPTRRPFMLDVTEEGLVPKHHRHFYHSVISKGIHCVLSKFWSEDCNHLIFLINFISLLEPNTSNIDADKLFLIILTSLNCFLALYHLCASVLEKKKKVFYQAFRLICEESTWEPFSSQSSFMDLAAYITWQCFVWSALITRFCLPACEKTHECTTDDVWAFMETSH